jgi:hypothetical protein
MSDMWMMKKKNEPVLMLGDLSPDEVAFLFSYNPISIHPSTLSVPQKPLPSPAMRKRAPLYFFLR